MKRFCLGCAILSCGDLLWAMQDELDKAKVSFLGGEPVCKTVHVDDNATDVRGKMVAILHHLQQDCYWRPSNALDGVAAKQGVANLIGQYIDKLIRDNACDGAEKWLEVESSLTRDEEMVARHTVLIKSLKDSAERVHRHDVRGG